MSQTFYKPGKKSRLSDKNSGKCGEICIQWDAFINHMEERHDGQLRADPLLQQELEEVNVDDNNSKESSPIQLLEELPQSSRIRVRSEFNPNRSAETLFDYDDPLMGNVPEKYAKADTFNSIQCRVVNEAKSDQTCDSIDEQKTFDSILSLSETDSDLEPTNAQPNPIFLQPDKLTPIITNVSCIGDAQFISLRQDSTILSRSFQQQLPSAENIKQIPDLKNILKIDVFENKHRTRLAKGLINFILYKQPDRKLFKDDFLQLAQSIVEIFPSEVKETYYVPYKTGHTAKGKLFDAYNNTRTRLSVAGLIRRRVKSKPEENFTLGNGNACGNENTEDIDESELNILKSVCSEWNLVLETWRKTHYFRQRELKNQNIKTHEYIAKYKVLLHEKNYELFDIDFKMLYPTSKNFYEWKLYYRQIIAKADKLKDRSVRDILTYISDTEEEDSKLALSLMLIAYILPNPRQRTKLEIQECFISYCKNIIDEEEETTHHTKRLKAEGYPKIYLVGDSSKTICEAFVDLCGTRLKFSNPIRAIEVCFHYFMVMNIEYPRYCTHIWIFIQKLIYEVTTPRDAVIPAINTLINDLRLDKL